MSDPDAAVLIDGAIGDGSQFHLADGYYAHGVGPETAKAPRGWQERLVKHEVLPRRPSQGTTVAWCLEAHDLVLSKCAAGRDRDWYYAAEALKAGVVQGDVLVARVPELPIPEEERNHLDQTLRSMIASQ